MKLDNATVLVTGALGALGLAFASRALARTRQAAAAPARRALEGDKPAQSAKRSQPVNPAVYLDVLTLDA
jgi:NAD(P)-dependent dehydrogenase (short-subunit alcohol dehydrogenase family)